MSVEGGGVGYLTSLSLFCCGESKNLSNAVGGRPRDSATSVFIERERVEIEERYDSTAVRKPGRTDSAGHWRC